MNNVHNLKYMPNNTTQTTKYMTAVNQMRRGALTIPAEIREQADWQDGLFFEIVFNKKTKHIYLKPQKKIDEEEFVELSETGEKMLREAMEELKNGKGKSFDNIEDLLADLRH